MGDYDNDGWPDLFVGVRGGGDNLLYHNRRDGTFERVTGGVVVQDGGDTTGVAWADYDQDGFLDLFISDLGSRVRLYHNEGGRGFSQVGGLFDNLVASVGCAWGDYDNDGDLDLLSANGAARNNVLYRNDGGGRFSLVASGPVVSDGGYSTSAAWGDYDNDGDLDLFIPNRAGPDFLYRNLGDGSFARVTGDPFASDTGEANGCAWADFDNDGDLDLFVANYQASRSLLYRNDGGGRFTKMPDELPVLAPNQAVGVGVADYDGDGFVDLFVSQLTGGVDCIATAATAITG
ncbi:MAG: VCBS repeat-containing protein [Verrucomicrobia bacterium]|nr:VCBS repeat-containing protein [Verrucomicrobiota bacterium]